MTHIYHHTPIYRHAPSGMALTTLIKAFILMLALYSLPCFGEKQSDITTNEARLVSTARHLAEKGETARSIQLLNKIIAQNHNAGNSITQPQKQLLVQAYELNGRNYDTLGDKEQALSNLNNALKLANTLDDDEQLCRIYNSLFAIYYSLRDFEPVSDILNRALAIAKKAGNKKMICTLYNNMGLMAYEQGAYGKALQLMDQALNYATDDVKATASVLTNKAEVYYKTGDYAATDDILNRVIAMLHNTEPALIIQPYLNSALVKAQLKKKAELKPLLHTIYSHLGKCPAPVQSNSYQQLAEIHFVIGDSLAGLRDVLHYEQINDSLNKVSNNNQVRQLLMAYHADRLKMNNNLLEAKVSSRTTLLAVSLVFLLILGALLALLYRQMVKDRLKAKQIVAQQKLLHEYEQKENERQKQEMSIELEHKNRQLTSYAIDTAAMNEFHEKIRNLLMQLKNEVTTMTDEQRQLVTDMMNQLLHYNDKSVLDDFRLYFDEVHPEMLKRLSEQYPQLSEKDLRLCAYIHLGMSTKEIAALTFREVRSVDSARNRLRKKLDLPAEESLQQFFKSFELQLQNQR